MGEHIDPKKIIKKIIYHHPVFTSEAILAQKRHKEIDGIDKISLESKSLKLLSSGKYELPIRGQEL